MGSQFEKISSSKLRHQLKIDSHNFKYNYNFRFSKQPQFPFFRYRTIVLIALFSQYINKFEIPFAGFSKQRGGCYVGRYPLFRLFPVSTSLTFRYFANMLKPTRSC